MSLYGSLTLIWSITGINILKGINEKKIEKNIEHDT